MPLYRHALPQLGGELFVTDGGIETTLIFHYGLELPGFASFVLLESEGGLAALTRYFQSYATLAVRHGTGLVLETPTWRANRDWGARLGYGAADLVGINRRAIRLLRDLRNDPRLLGRPVVLSGNLGPRGDGYIPSARMAAAEAEAYHAEQIATFAETAADMVSALTINYVDEAIGIAEAARKAGMPATISFTLETDGHLASGETLQEAVERTDAASGGHPAYYMINCAHPSHFADRLVADGPWLGRVRGVRANASRLSHAALNEAPALDTGNPEELAEEIAALRDRLPALNVIGGCCGTDHRHVGAMLEAVHRRTAA